MEANYHNEALRKKRILDRKCEAMERMKEGFGLSGQGSGDVPVHQKGDPPLVHAEPGQYLQSRLSFFKIGTERDRRQYDHSRNGPIVDRTRYDLKREFNFLGGSLNNLKTDIVPEHKPTPLCSKFY